MPEITKLDSLQAYLKASNAESLSIIEGTASRCSQCKAIAPEYAKLPEQYPDATFYQFDIDEVPDVAQELGINLIPTFKIFKDGELLDGVTGAKLKELKGKIEQNLK